MFYYINGTVAHLSQNFAAIDCSGVCYALNVSLPTLSSLKTGEKAKLFTYLHVREDIFELYGFLSPEELSSFKMLIGISGVGPKAALSILSAVPPANLALAVVTGDEKALTAASGVGKKLAQRVVLELKDKMKHFDFDTAPAAAGLGALAAGTGAEALAALQVLGYSRSEAVSALGGLDDSVLSVEDLVRMALKRLAK